MTDETVFVPAEAFCPGDFIADELAARGWTHYNFGIITGWSEVMIANVVSGARLITAQIAKDLSDAFGTSEEYWIKLERTYRQSLRAAAEEKSDSPLTGLDLVL